MKFSTILAAITASYVQAQTVTVKRTDGTSNGLYAPVGQCQGLGGAPISLVQFPQGGGLGVKFYRDFSCKGGEITMVFREQTLSPPISPNSYRIYYERGPTQESFYNAPQYFNVPQYYNPPMYFNAPQYYNYNDYDHRRHHDNDDGDDDDSYGRYLSYNNYGNNYDYNRHRDYDGDGHRDY